MMKVVHARGAIFRGVGDEGESCGHLSIDDIIPGSARGVRSLACQDPEKITIEGYVRADLVLGEILSRVSDERVNRAVILIGCFPPNITRCAFPRR